ncbi:hypothetical protein G6F22_015397 [Rhizopus arrhizus]|nr:hypothetical protein G6F22_015397 [Rhizopus arrhizus]
MTDSPTVPSTPAGVSAPAFAMHPGYRRMFAPNQLTIGIFLPLRFYQGDMAVLQGQANLVADLDRRGFAAVWVRDVPLFDPNFGDAGQVFDPFSYLAYLAARTERIALATGSAVFPLRHPIDLAKVAATLDRLSGGRLVMGIASGDRPVEFPAYGLDPAQRGERFAQTVSYFRQLMHAPHGAIDSPLGRLAGPQLLPKPAAGRVPLLITGSCQQTPQWHARRRGSASAGAEDPRLARTDSRRRIPPACHQRMAGPERRPGPPAYAHARRLRPAHGTAGPA